MQYAEVIVDLASESVDRVFTYSVPEHLALEAGHRVLVPFGSRKIEGFVMDFKSEPGMDPARIRPVLARLEDYPALLPEMIELARWMRERYHCNLVDALRLMIPAQMRGIRPVLARLEDYPALLPEMIELARWMRERYHCNLVDALRLMIPAQMRGGRVREKTVRVAALCLEGQALDAALQGLNRAPKQKALVEALRNGPLPTGVLNAMIPGADAALRALAEKGVVSIAADEVQRREFDQCWLGWRIIPRCCPK